MSWKFVVAGLAFGLFARSVDPHLPIGGFFGTTLLGMVAFMYVYQLIRGEQV